MEQSDISNTQSIMQTVTTGLVEELFHEYVKLIFDTLSIKVERHEEKVINIQIFQDYLNLPLFISEQLFSMTTKLKTRYLNEETFYWIMKNCFLYNNTELETSAKVEFFMTFFSELNGDEYLYENDFKLVFYHFHMLSNSSKQHIAKIDLIVDNFFRNRVASKNNQLRIKKSEFLEGIKGNSDLFYLFYFFMNYYKPYDRNEILFILTNYYNFSDGFKDSVSLKNSLVSSYLEFNLSSPSKELFDYLNCEFKVSLFFDDDIDTELKELEEFMNDIVNVKIHNGKTTVYFQFDKNFTLFPNHLFVKDSFKLYFIRNSYLEIDKNEKNTLNLILCNNVVLSLSFKTLETTSSFYKRYKQFQPRTALEDHYEIKDNLYEGQFGVIKTCKLKNDNTGQLYALKTIFKNKNYNYRWEIYISKFLSSLNIGGVAKIYNVFEVKDKAYIIIEYGKEGNLNDVLCNEEELLSGNEITILLQNIIDAEKTLNRFGIIHRDIKPENILLGDNFEVKFIDFGFSQVVATNQRLRKNCGTICFACPEIIMKKSYSIKADYWSIGIIAYYLQFGELPFDDEDDNLKNITDKIINIRYELPREDEIDNYSNFAYEVIKNFLKYEHERADLSMFI